MGTLQQGLSQLRKVRAFVIVAAPWSLLWDFRQTHKAGDPQKAFILLLAVFYLPLKIF